MPNHRDLKNFYLNYVSVQHLFHFSQFVGGPAYAYFDSGAGPRILWTTLKAFLLGSFLGILNGTISEASFNKIKAGTRMNLTSKPPPSSSTVRRSKIPNGFWFYAKYFDKTFRLTIYFCLFVPYIPCSLFAGKKCLYILQPATERSLNFYNLIRFGSCD